MVHATAFSVVTSQATASAVLTLGDYARGWERRWQEAQRDLRDLLVPQTVPSSNDTIHAAARHLRDFYIQTYHIKDALKHAASTTGISSATVENVVTGEPTLALLADLANLDKHSKLSHPPRSGQVPRIKPLASDGAHCDPGTW